MLAVRQAAAEQRRARARRRTRARGRSRARRSPSTAAATATPRCVGALTIALREGLEIALLIGALLGLVRKRGQPQLARFVHAGWMLAVVSGLLTWMLASQAALRLAPRAGRGHRRAARGGGVARRHALAARTAHRQALHGLSRRAHGRRRRAGAPGSASSACRSSRRTARRSRSCCSSRRCCSMPASSASRVWLGAALGLLALCAVTLALKRIGQRLQPRPFMLMSSALLAALSFALAGKGIRALQEAAVLGMTEVRGPELAWLGVYPTVQGLLCRQSFCSCSSRARSGHSGRSVKPRARAHARIASPRLEIRHFGRDARQQSGLTTRAPCSRAAPDGGHVGQQGDWRSPATRPALGCGVRRARRAQRDGMCGADGARRRGSERGDIACRACRSSCPCRTARAVSPRAMPRVKRCARACAPAHRRQAGASGVLVARRRGGDPARSARTAAGGMAPSELARDVRISQLAIFQAVKIPLMQDGEEVIARNAPSSSASRRCCASTSSRSPGSCRAT